MRKSAWLTSLTLFCVLACTVPERDSVKTTFQTGQGWRPTIDNRADAVMVYGVGGNPTDKGAPGSVEARLASWRERGYDTHFMTGIAWGGYQDYFTGSWDGEWHLDEGQVRMEGDTIWHGLMVPYIVPTENYLAYFVHTTSTELPAPSPTCAKPLRRRSTSPASACGGSL
jgi:hypothetical protein